MKKVIIILLVGFFLCITGNVIAQLSLNQVETNIASGNVTELMKNLDEKVKITFPEEAKEYAHKQAQLALNKFFAKYEPKGFTIKRKGKSSSNNTLFAIGTLITRRSDFRVYLFFVPKNGTYILKEIRFDKS